MSDTDEAIRAAQKVMAENFGEAAAAAGAMGALMERANVLAFIRKESDEFASGFGKAELLVAEMLNDIAKSIETGDHRG